MKYDKDRYKVWSWKHPLILHWIINPGLAFNEIFLGQRQPRVSLIDKKSNAPFMERTYVPCPHCETLHDGRLWAGKNAFGHWLGFVCPECKEVIPCLWNLTSLLVLLLTFPIWLPLKLIFKNKWLKYESTRISKAVIKEPKQAKDVKWWTLGIFWGTFMFILMELLPYFKEKSDPSELLAGALIWLLGGLFFGLIMKLVMNKKTQNQQVDPTVKTPVD